MTVTECQNVPKIFLFLMTRTSKGFLLSCSLLSKNPPSMVLMPLRQLGRNPPIASAHKAAGLQSIYCNPVTPYHSAR